jgi:hypothetical protein
MWEDLEEFHKLDILIAISTILKYMDGKLIDFSRFWTTPHPSFTLNRVCVATRRTNNAKQRAV